MEIAVTQLPTELRNIGPEKRSYDILSFSRGDEPKVLGHTMVERAKGMNAHLGQDDGQYLLDNQQDIPASLRGRVAFVFTDWCRHGNSGCVYGVYWMVVHWVQGWHWLDYDSNDNVRLLRRK